MPDIQEDLTALSVKGTKFTAETLKKMMEYLLKGGSLALKGTFKIGGKIAEFAAEKIAENFDEQKNKVSIDELVAMGGTQSSLTVFEHDKLFDDVMKDYGIKYTVMETPLKDDKGEPIIDTETGEPKKQFTVFFDARNTEVMQAAYKDFVDRSEKVTKKEASRTEKIQDIKDKIKYKVNIKQMIKTNTERANNINKNNPEKHHNRGAQSL